MVAEIETLAVAAVLVADADEDMYGNMDYGNDATDNLDACAHRSLDSHGAGLCDE